MQICRAPMMWDILKDCVINHTFYGKGELYIDPYPQGNKKYLQVLADHGFIRPYRRVGHKIDIIDQSPATINLDGYVITIEKQ